jgi:hypothetical protein
MAIERGGLGTPAARADSNFSAAPVVEIDYDETTPPEGELGSSFSYDSPFEEFKEGNVFAYEEPLVKDYQHMLRTDITSSLIVLQRLVELLTTAVEQNHAATSSFHSSSTE